MTSHPWDLSDRLIAALADCPSVCEHLHLPVQSGDDAVLRRMGRQYTIEHYRERLDPDPRGRPGHHRLDRRHRRLLRRDRGAVRATLRAARGRSATTRSSPRPTRRGPARPRRASPTTCPRTIKRRRLNELLAVQEGDRPRAQPGVAGPRRRGARRHDHAAHERTPTTPMRERAPPRPARPTASGCPAERVATSSSTSRESRSCSAARSPCASIMPARMPCAGRSSRRNNRPSVDTGENAPLP